MKELKEVGGLENTLIEAQVNDYEELQKTRDNANEVEHTGNVGFGKELIPDDILTNQVISIIPTYGTFINALPGFHGNSMGKSVSVPIIGEIGFAVMGAERTSAALAHQQANRKLPTAKVTITQESIIAQVDISAEELRYSVVKLEEVVKKGLAASFAKTMESAMLNADSTVTATGNINCDDAVPSATFDDGVKDHRLGYDNGLRKTVLGGTVNVDYKSIGAMTWSNIMDTRALLGDWSFDLQDLLLLMNGATYNKAITIAEFADASKNGEKSTIATGAITRISGNNVYIPRAFPKTEADGKKSSTASNNTKGGFMYMKKQALQFGFGAPLDMETYKILGQGISIVAAMDFGFAVVNKQAGTVDPRIVMGINVTL